MIEIVAFDRKHLNDIDPYVFGFSVKDHIREEHLEQLELSRYSYSILKDGKVLACLGVVMHWQGRGECWAVLDKHLKHDFIHIHKAAKFFLNQAEIKRIEAVVACDHDKGLRWAKSLGFNLEAECMKSYGIDGKDYALFSIVKGGL